jgi:putative chitinase
MAQIEAESNFRPRSEDVDKYSAKTLYRLFPKKFADVNAAQALVDQGPEAVGNHIYGSRMGNAADEGYKYRGRGLIQLTGKDNYTTYGKKLGLDLVSNPDLANDPAIAARIAAVYFADKQSHGANLSDINSIGKAVGYAGGQSETAKRAKLAENYKGQIASGSLGTAGSSSAAPAASATPSATPSIQEKPPQTASAITPEQIVDSQNVSDELSSARISNGVSKVVGDSNTKVADGLDKLNNNVAQVAVNTSSPVTNTVTTTNNTSNSNATNAQSNNSNESIPPEVYNLIFAQFDA